MLSKDGLPPSRGGYFFGWFSLLWLVICVSAVGLPVHATRTLIPARLVELHRDQGSMIVKSWPVTFGVPFKQAAVATGTRLGVDRQGMLVPA